MRSVERKKITNRAPSCTRHAHDAPYWQIYSPLPRVALRVVCLDVGGGAVTCLVVLLVTFLAPAWPPLFTPVPEATPGVFGDVTCCFLGRVFGAFDSVGCGLGFLSFFSTGAKRSRASRVTDSQEPQKANWQLCWGQQPNQVWRAFQEEYFLRKNL